MPEYRFLQVDVFTDEVFGGNPLAVFPDAEGLTTTQMQQIAREMNLSETTFVTPSNDPAAAFAVRIFTPDAEMPFAGHPVVGTHWTLAHLGRVALQEPITTVRFKLGVGVRAAALHVSGGQVTRVVMDHQTPEFGPIATPDQVNQIAEGLNLDPAAIFDTGKPVQVVSTGVRQLFVPVRSLEEVQGVSTKRQNTNLLSAVMEELDPETHCHECLMILTTERTVYPTAAVHTRLFAPGMGIPEDPATGSATGGLGAYLVQHGLIDATPPVTHIQSEQGIEMGRTSHLSIEVEGEPNAITMVRVGGSVVPVLEGTLRW